MLRRLSSALDIFHTTSRSRAICTPSCPRTFSSVTFTRHGTHSFEKSLPAPNHHFPVLSISVVNTSELGRRCLSSPSAEPSSPADSTSFPDPSRPDLFYHLIYPPSPLSNALPVYALSFLPDPPPKPDSACVIGWLPAQTEGSDAEAGLNDFMENPKFREILNAAIQAGLREDVDEIQRNGAIQMREGWMHIHDDRNVPALGRIGDPDDILASVLVENSQILADTYQPMPAYRLATSDGITQLTPGLAQKLKEVLQESMRKELE
ncbi:hypothetical protein K435DRAFT_753798 [Dendrothele bispora CBS 962.96]|uniref:Uncharacterized protein n=1 Tax=Dendrothele bispora (strain CBS 962.96) TaxID=1314807 RepID=A0A4S8M742_DENBC|nr:hypothetical protein K435DRAFT_753798 [Dendrothele bispora CBS 962.96]